MNEAITPTIILYSEYIYSEYIYYIYIYSDYINQKQCNEFEIIILPCYTIYNVSN